MSVEQEIWGNEAPQGNVSIESVRDRLSSVPAGARQSRCATHGVTGCLACLVAQRDAAKASVPAPAVPATAPPVVQPAPLIAPAPEAEPPSEIVAMAQEFAAAVQRLQREQNLLVAAELRVESLKESIAMLKVAAEEARMKLAKLVSTGEEA